MDGFVALGGAYHSDLATDGGLERLQSHLSNLLQVANIAVLVGAGASFDLGGPGIRRVTGAELEDMLRDGPGPLTGEETEALAPFVEKQPFDLEHVLAAVSHAISLGSLLGGSTLAISGVGVSLDALTKTRAKVAAAIATACNVPSPAAMLPAPLDDEPLLAHRTFLRHLVRVRRRDLSRPWVFTTNYDLALEKAMDAEALPYIDGFTGTIQRVFAPQVYEQDVFIPQRLGDTRILRLPDLLYLVKMHGSINWTVADTASVLRSSPGGVESGEEAVIYPTPLKESETLGYPYADLMRIFASTLARPDTALITLGYGFADEHINRIIRDQLVRNRSLQVCITSPTSIGTIVTSAGEPRIEFDDNECGRLAATTDRRISAVGGEAARFTPFALEVFPQPQGVAETSS